MNDWLILEKFEYSDYSKFKECIDNAIVKNNIQSITQGKSTTGINSKQYDLMNCLTDIYDTVIKIQNKVEYNLKKNNFIDKNSKLKAISAWTILGYKNCFHTMHQHNSKLKLNHIASSTYISLPQNDENHPGNFYAILKDIFGENDYFEHDPKLGEIIIFPIWLYHGTYPQGEGLRQTLNVDFEII
jgi:hypothetical protein